jgi:hypothetical protein
MASNPLAEQRKAPAQFAPTSVMECRKTRLSERDPGGKGKIGLRPATQLKELGVTKSESSRWQQLAALPKEDQESKRQCQI